MHAPPHAFTHTLFGKQQFKLLLRGLVLWAGPLGGSPKRMSTVFVTVGTTSFDDLFRAVDTDEFARAMAARGVERITCQIGRGAAKPPDRCAAVCACVHFIEAFIPGHGPYAVAGGCGMH